VIREGLQEKIKAVKKIGYEELRQFMLGQPGPDEPDLPEMMVFDETQPGAELVRLVSYQRSGSTMTRAYVEKIMGIYTGNDEGGLNVRGTMGLYQTVGCDNRTILVKSHVPMNSRPCEVSRAVVILRSPFDVIPSFFNLHLTGSHTKTEIDGGQFIESLFQKFAVKNISIWRDWVLYWVKKKKIPLHFIRYEDLLSDPEPVLKRTLEFIMGVPDISGTRLERYVKTAVSEKSPQMYVPRQGKVNANMHLFSENLKNSIFNKCGPLFNHFFPELVKAQTNEK